MKPLKKSKMKHKAFVSSLIGWAIVIAVIIFGVWLIVKIVDFKDFSLGEENNEVSDFFSVEFIGSYANGNFGDFPSGCTQDTQTKIITCNSGTLIEFYVGLINKGAVEGRNFYASPCIIKDYKKGDKCDTYYASPNKCYVDPLKIGNCAVGKEYKLEKGTYRVFAGGQCLYPECYNPQDSSTNEPKYNQKSFLDITVK